jgi:hypothetical protein
MPANTVFVRLMEFLFLNSACGPACYPPDY